MRANLAARSASTAMVEHAPATCKVSGTAPWRASTAVPRGSAWNATRARCAARAMARNAAARIGAGALSRRVPRAVPATAAQNVATASATVRAVPTSECVADRLGACRRVVVRTLIATPTRRTATGVPAKTATTIRIRIRVCAVSEGGVEVRYASTRNTMLSPMPRSTRLTILTNSGRGGRLSKCAGSTTASATPTSAVPSASTSDNTTTRCS